MAIIHEGSAPYAPAVQVLGALNHFREKGAAQFSKQLLMKLGAPAPYANRTISALKLLDLIDDEGTPTPAFVELQRAGESEYRPRLEQIIRTAYDEVFQVVDPATASGQAVMDAFRFYQPVAQRDKMVTLFLALCEEAGIVGSDKAPRKRGRTKTIPQRQPGMAMTPTRAKDDPPPPSPPADPTRHDPPKPVSGTDALKSRYIEVLIEKAATSDDDKLLDRIEALLLEVEAKD